MFTGILSSECQEIEGIDYMSAHLLWHFITQLYKSMEYSLMGKYSLIELYMVIPYNNIKVQYVVTADLSCMSLFLFFPI